MECLYLYALEYKHTRITGSSVLTGLRGHPCYPPTLWAGQTPHRNKQKNFTDNFSCCLTNRNGDSYINIKKVYMIHHHHLIVISFFVLFCFFFCLHMKIILSDDVQKMKLEKIQTVQR